MYGVPKHCSGHYRFIVHELGRGRAKDAKVVWSLFDDVLRWTITPPRGGTRGATGPEEPAAVQGQNEKRHI